jgi:hypothetical protein
VSNEKYDNSGKGKRHRNPPLRIKRIVCFGESTWMRLKKVVGSPSAVKGDKAGRREAKEVKKALKADPGKKGEVGYFILGGIRTSTWWEGENWAMVTDPGNPFGDLTREEGLKVREILKRVER